MKKETRPPRDSRTLQHQQLALHAGSQAAVVLHLCNGTRLQGVVIAVDSYLLMLGKDLQDSKPIAVYKHAIAMVTPAGPDDSVIPAPQPDMSPDFVSPYIPRKGRRR